MPHESVSVLVCAGLLVGCTDLDRFTTGPNESYCGSVTLGAPFRTGFSPRVQMRLTIDAGALDGASSPGMISTYEAPFGDQNEKRLLNGTPLRPIPALRHDALSQLELGEGRERNAIFGVTPQYAAAADAGAVGLPDSILAVISLKSDDSVEVRLVRPGSTATSGQSVDEAHEPLFGLFPLSKQNGSCGF